MLTPDLVRARRRDGELRVVPLSDDERARAEGYAQELIFAASSAVGGVREDLTATIEAIAGDHLERRLRGGLVKLTLDRCDIESDVGEVAPKLRARLFELSAAKRQAGEFDRSSIINQVAGEFAIDADAVERGMYGDLRAAHLVRGFETTTPEALVAEFEHRQVEAILLRATRVAVQLKSPDAAAARLLFRRVKFLGLLFTIERAEKGYRVVIDGPMSLFESQTTYGLKFGLLSRSLDGCGPWSLVADILWGREREPLVFRTKSEREATPAELPVSSEALELVQAVHKLGSGWRGAGTTKVLHLPGAGMSIPDLVFKRLGATVYLEVLGHWSRAAVWKRVELVEAGLAAKVIFAVNRKLRVSEEVLSDESPSSLYTYARSMSARAVVAKLDALAARPKVADRDDEDELERGAAQAKPPKAPRKKRASRKRAATNETTATTTDG